MCSELEIHFFLNGQSVFCTPFTDLGFSHWFEIMCSCFTSLYPVMPTHKSLSLSSCSWSWFPQCHQQSSTSGRLWSPSCLMLSFKCNASFKCLVNDDRLWKFGVRKICFNIFLRVTFLCFHYELEKIKSFLCHIFWKRWFGDQQRNHILLKVLMIAQWLTYSISTQEITCIS